MSQSPRQPAPATEVVPEALRRYRERRDRMDSIDLVHVFEALEGEPNQDGDPLKWKVDGYNIIHKGQGWKNVSTDVHWGGGGVALVQHIKQFEHQRDAVKWMEQHPLLGGALEGGADLKAAAKTERRTKADFEPPDRLDEMLPEVEDYLVNKRGLPPSLIKEQVASGNLYASRRWDERDKRYKGFARCVFLGPASAEIRELGADGFKGCCRGSQTDVSGFRVPFVKAVSENILAMQEAAVDALSYRSLFPGRYTFSTNGVGRFNLQYKLTIQAIESGVGVRLALDADFAGDMASQRIFNALFLRHRLSKHLGVEPEQIDAWLTSDSIALASDEPTGGSDDADTDEPALDQRVALATLPGNSPHELFFTTGWQPELPERLPEMVQVPGKDKPKRVWKETGRKLPPMIRLNVMRDVHPRMPKGEHWLKVSKADFDYITREMNVRRDRTPWGKDWNDALRKLGSSYTLAYEKAAKADFANGVPPLPRELEVLRTPGLPSAPAPNQAPATAPAAAGPEGGRSRPLTFPARAR